MILLSRLSPTSKPAAVRLYVCLAAACFGALNTASTESVVQPHSIRCTPKRQAVWLVVESLTLP